MSISRENENHTRVLRFLLFFGQKVQSKKKHPYNRKNQLRQLLLNVQKCHLVVYSSFDKSMYVVSVPFDKIFAFDMLKTGEREMTQQPLFTNKQNGALEY